MNTIETRQQTNISLKTGWLVIGLVAAGSAAAFLFFSRPAPQITVQPKPTPQQLNSQFLETLYDYAGTPVLNQPAKLDTLRQAASKRRQVMAELLKTNPTQFLKLALPGSVRNHLPPSIQPLVEQETVLEGTLVHEHKDFASGTSTEQDVLVTSNDGIATQTPVYFALAPSSTLYNAKVKLHGSTLDGNLATAGSPQTTEVITAAPVVAPVIGKKKLAVILVNFQNQTITPQPVVQVRGKIFTNSDSVSKYYQENSNNTTTPVELVGKNNNPDGDIYGWVTIPMNYSPCQYINWGPAADALVDPGHLGILDGYDQRMYVFNGPDCPGLNGVTAQYLWIMYGDFRTYAHEIGHWFGKNHAASTRCTTGNSPVVIGQNCGDYNVTLNYGDPFDVMGGANSRHMANYRKEYFGWYLPSSTVTVTASGTNIPLEPSDTISSGSKVLRIPRRFFNGQLLDYYYLEYRQPFGIFENYTPTGSEYNGVMIRVGLAYSGLVDSYLIDATPATSTNFGDAALLSNQEINDPTNGVTIKTTSVSTTGATVDITLECKHPNPSLVMTVFPTAIRPGTTATATLSAANNDNPNVCLTPGHYTLTATLPSGWTMQPIPALTLNPNVPVLVSPMITAPATPLTDFRNIPLTLTRTDPGVTGSYTINVTYVVDGVSPTATITQPASGSTLPTSGTVTILSSGADDSYSVAMKIAIDGTTVQQCPLEYNETPCFYDWSMGQVTAGQHTITATATDEAGNIGTSSINVYYPVGGGGGGGCADENHNGRIDPWECMPLVTQ